MEHKIEIEFEGNKKKEILKGTSAYDAFKEEADKHLSEALAAKFDDKEIDLHAPLTKSGKLTLITANDKEGLGILRHSAAHLMAQAIMHIFPNVKLTIGPVVEEGFYYDMEAEPFKPEDIEKIEKEMKKLVHDKIRIVRKEITKAEALELFKSNPFKVEMINELEDGKISVYEQGDFVDLCRGPHVPNTGHIKGFKILKVAGAYWRADAKNKQLQRVYGIAFLDKDQLQKYLTAIEEAKKRDHKKIGREMDLFSIPDEGPGFPLIHPKGLIIWQELENLWKDEHRKAHYLQIRTPIILSRSLWEQSGHWDHYKENMYFTKIDGKDFAVKPMNCPGSILFYKTKIHSYKELPLRVAEMGLVHRHELSGVLNGLFRVRSFVQDDAHIYCRPDQIEDEVVGVINLIDKFYKTFNLEYHVELSTKPDKAMGDPKLWEKAEAALENALKKHKINYKINPGDGAFYGPKIDFHVKDSLGRTWQLATCQLDFQMPEKFDLRYMAEDGTLEHRPAMIHRVIYGAMERFLGILIENYAGKFPLWLSPVHARILTVSDKFNDYANEVEKKMFDAGLRVEVDHKTDSVPKKVRNAQIDRIPLVLTVGEKEVAEGTVAVRTLEGNVKFGVKVDEFIEAIKKNIHDREAGFKP